MAGFFLMCGHFFVFLAFRFANARLVAPFTYSFTLWAVLFGFVIFGDIPNSLAVAGMALVMVTGLAVLIFEGRERARENLAALKNRASFAGTFSTGSCVSRDASTSNAGENLMEDAGVGWIAAIIIGGVAGWLAEQFMKSNMGMLMNIILGIVGAIIASALLSVFGVQLTGWIGYLIAGFIGAVILIAIGRAVRR